MFGPPFLKRLGIGAAVVLAAGGSAAATLVPAYATSASVATQQAAHTQATTGPTASSPAATPPARSATKAHRHPLVGAILKATVKETGLPAATVMQDLKAGQTIDAIAGSKAGAVESDVLGALQTRLDKAVAAGKITKAQEADLLARAKTRVEKLMSANLSKHARAAA